MLTSDYHFDLPSALIAQHPPTERSAGRLLCCDGARQRYEDRLFRQLPDQLRAGDLLVFNDTRVIPARLCGEKKITGGRVEVLVERIVADDRALCHIRASKAPGPGTPLRLSGGIHATVLQREGDLFLLEVTGCTDLPALLERCGSVPLPPYIARSGPPPQADGERYQTVYAANPGAVAAPTAGLHFDRDTFAALADRGVATAFITLHVGAGTFQPVRVADPAAHVMHSERVQVSAAVCEKIAAARARNGRVIAVGTTVVRSLEAATAEGVCQALAGETALFIRPGYRFRCVDALLTNFHLPESTLLMLVCAFGGYDLIMAAYRHAVCTQYRFFSYGDAMLVHPTPAARPDARRGR